MLGRTRTLEVLVEDIGQPQHCKVVEEDGVGVGDRVHEGGHQRADVEDTQHSKVEREYTWVSACGSDIKCGSILSAHVWVVDVQPGSYAASHLVQYILQVMEVGRSLNGHAVSFPGSNPAFQYRTWE